MDAPVVYGTDATPSVGSSGLVRDHSDMNVSPNLVHMSVMSVMSSVVVCLGDLIALRISSSVSSSILAFRVEEGTFTCVELLVLCCYPSVRLLSCLSTCKFLCCEIYGLLLDPCLNPNISTTC